MMQQRGACGLHSMPPAANPVPVAPITPRPVQLPLKCPSIGPRVAPRKSTRLNAAFTDRSGGMAYPGGVDLRYIGSWMSRLTASQNPRQQAEQQKQVARLQLELDAALREVDHLHEEAAASQALREELAAKTAELATMRDELMYLESHRTEELQASFTRYRELEDALAVAESNMEHAMSSENAQLYEARSAVLEAELEDAQRLSDMLQQQLQHAQQARDAAERAQREAEEQAQRAQREAVMLSRQLDTTKGELSYVSEGASSMDYESTLRAELAEAQHDADELHMVVKDMRDAVEDERKAAARGGGSRRRWQELQARLSLSLLQADQATQRAQEIEDELMAITHGQKKARAAPQVQGQGTNAQREAMASAQMRLGQLEADVARAMRDCDAASAALSEALRGQVAAEEEQAAVEQQLRYQSSRIAELEDLLQDQVGAGRAAAQRERALESQLGQQAQRADEATQRAYQLEHELLEQTKAALLMESNRTQEIEDQLRSLYSKISATEEKASKLQNALGAERQRADAMLHRAQQAETQVSELRYSEAQAQEATRNALAAKQAILEELEAEKSRAGQLTSELEVVRREAARAEHEMTALTMQAQRAQQAAERSNIQLMTAQSQLAELQAKLSEATAEVELLRERDALRQVELEKASDNARALHLEVTGLRSLLSDRDTALAHWKQEAELATQLAEAAANAQENAIAMVTKLQQELSKKELEKQNWGAEVASLRAELESSHSHTQALRAELSSGGGNTVALRAQLEASQDQVQRLNGELSLARARMAQAEAMNDEIKEKAQAEVSMFKEVLEATEAAAMKMGQQLLALMREKEAGGAPSASSIREPSGRVVVRREFGQRGSEDYITEEEVDGLLTELDLTRAELEEAIKLVEEATGRAEGAEAMVSLLQSRLDDATRRTREADEAVAKLQMQIDELAAKEGGKKGGPRGKGSDGKRMKTLMEELSTAKAAAKAAEAAAEQLAADKQVLLQELAFGAGTGKRKQGDKSDPGASNGQKQGGNIKSWRLPSWKLVQ